MYNNFLFYNSKYIFLILISLFLISNFVIFLRQKKAKDKKAKISYEIAFQKIIILIFHCFGFYILALDYKTKTFDTSLISPFLSSLIFLIMANFLQFIVYKKSCPILWNCLFFVLSVSTIMLYRLNPSLALKQMGFHSVGFYTALFIPLILLKFPNISLFKTFYLFLSFYLLVLTLLLGQESNGSKNWLSLFGFTFQPSEVIKILFVLYLTTNLAKENLRIKDLLLPSLGTFIILGFLALQKDLGSALIFFVTYLILCYIATQNYKLLIVYFVLGGIIAYFAYKYFSHVKVRIDVWLNPWSDISGSGWQIAQSLFAIGTFGLFGSGLNLGTPTSIPVVEKDLIFSAICEEFGVIFAILLILVLLIIFARCFAIALSSNSKFLSIFGVGLTNLLIFQTFLIIGGSIKFIPLTGVTIPFISYGGSSMLISFIIIGLLQWIALKNEIYTKNKETMSTDKFNVFLKKDTYY